MTEQGENLDRVSTRIGPAVFDFCCQHVGKQFFAEDLHQAVLRDTGIVAPASADRILRDLRQKGRIDYEVLNRRQSLYRMISVAVWPSAPPPPARRPAGSRVVREVVVTVVEDEVATKALLDRWEDLRHRKEEE